jgi:hypothetical protein
VYQRVAGDTLTKLADRSRLGLFVGIEPGVKGWKILNTQTGRFTTSRDVVFLEAPQYIPEGELQEHLIERPWSDDQAPAPATAAGVVASGVSQKAAAPTAAVEHTAFVVDVEPGTVQEALASDDAAAWQKAMDEELASLVANDTWEPCSHVSSTPLPSKWVFALKRNESGVVVRHKARLVARGDRQRAGIDYEETFSSTVRLETQRILLAYAAREGLLLHQIDIKTAYLNGLLDKPIALRLPSGDVVSLRKGLYGLKQAGRCWATKLRETLLRHSFEQLSYDDSVYVRHRDSPENRVIVSVYVDDIIICAPTIEKITEVKRLLASEYEVKDEGELHYILGLCVSRDWDKRTIKISQAAYIDRLLADFEMTHAKPLPTPMIDMTQSHDLSKRLDDRKAILYRSAIGKLNWLVRGSRPDLGYVLSVLAANLQSPEERHWANLKRVLRYVAGTRTIGITVGAGTIVGFADADYASAPDCGRRSTSGYMFHIGGPVSWSSKRQDVVALSSTEAEYMAIGHAGKEAKWLTALCAEMGFSIPSPMTIMVDNMSAIALTKNDAYHAKTKHIDVRHHWIREALRTGQFGIQHVPTEGQCADVMTKVLKLGQHQRIMRLNGQQ